MSHLKECDVFVRILHMHVINMKREKIRINRIFLSFLYTLYGQASGKSSEVATELSILVSGTATTCGWWKSRKASNSSFLPLMLLIFMLMNFNQLIKLLFLSIAWPTGVQLLVFFCSSVPVVLFDTPGISRCWSQHVPVESSFLLHHSIYLWFICFSWWSIDELENLHADRTTVCFEPW